MIILHKFNSNPNFRQPISIVRFSKKASNIIKATRLDQDETYISKLISQNP